jgi:phosphoribosylglycinamide formyltransferase 1
MKKIVLFASGNGSNAEKIILHFQNSPFAKVVAVFSNNSNAKVLEIAKNHQIDTVVFNKTELNEVFVLNKLEKIAPDLIVLAGFLLKFPENIIMKYLNKIINIHPALLPNYGGKGMFGMNVHRAVLENKELETGITIHYVNEHYDEGEYISQYRVSIKNCTNAEEVAKKVLELEHIYFPLEIEKLITHKS